MRDLPSTHLLGAGTSMCAGCGGLQAIKQAYDVLGRKTVFVNAAGCMTLLSTYPFTPFRGSWLYTSMASAPAGAQGIRDALDILQEKGRMPATDDLQVVVLAGDGSTNGMGLASTSAAIERRLKDMPTRDSRLPQRRLTALARRRIPARRESYARRRICSQSGRRTSRPMSRR
jgi:pyruvate ferredoxin oxidoreductase beta subunit